MRVFSARCRRWLSCPLGAVLLLAGTAAAQTAAPAGNPSAPAPPSRLTFSATWRIRGESWNWFTDGPADNRYSFGHSILRLGLGQRLRHFDWQVELAQPTVFGLPTAPIAAAPQGQLGLGGSYLAANGGSRNAAFIFPGKAFLRFRGFGGRDPNQLTIGRFAFVDGLEVMPKDPTLAWLKGARIAHRLLGDFGFSLTGRSADGAVLSLNPGSANLTFAAARPTRGVFQVDGLGELDVAWQYGSLTLPLVRARNVGELRLFGIGYQDFRAVDKTDNRPAALRPAADRFRNINLATVGFNYLHALRSRSAGTFDFLLWAAGQAGDWGTQPHRAGAVAVEAGWQPKAPHLRPWLRAGYFVGSGDGNPADGKHHTFFQVLPTPRIYARFPFYNLQNIHDASAALLLRPGAKLSLRSDFHRLWLASRNDLWYLGGGAFQPRTFGYTGRPSGRRRSLATLWDISADVQATRQWAVNFYYAHAWGGDVMKSIYPRGPNADFGYLELVFKY